jgi:ABC-type transport system involved in multi-copper enzyme maturation permease subunit
LSEFEKLKVVTKYELLKQIRRKRFSGALALTVLLVVLIIGLYQGLDLPRRMGIPEYLIDQYGVEIFAIFATSMGALAILSAVFFAGDVIASEFEHKTGYILFTNPVKRVTIVVGKYLACVIATATILIVAYMISAGALLVFYGTVPVGGMLGSIAIALMLACFMISMAFAFSSVLKGGMGATIATLLTYMAIFSVISMFLSNAGYNPWFMPDRAGDAMTATYGVSFEGLFGGMMGGGHMMTGMVQASQDPVLSFFVLLGYAVPLFGVSIWMTKRRDMI